MRFSAIPWLIVAAGTLFFANFDINAPRLRINRALPAQGVSVYVYERTCFPPDARTECRDYVNFVYVRRRFSPLLVLKARVRHVVDKVKTKNNRILLSAPGGSPGTEIKLR